MPVDFIPTSQGGLIHVHAYRKTIKKFGRKSAQMILDYANIITRFVNSEFQDGDCSESPYWAVGKYGDYLTLDIGDGFNFGKSKWSIFLVGMDVIQKFVNDDTSEARAMRADWNARFDKAGLLTDEYRRLVERDE